MKCWFGKHRKWEIVAPMITIMPDDESMSVTWAAIRCVRCGKVRETNVIKPGESLILDIENLVSGTGWLVE